MGLEAVTFINDFNVDWPLSTDLRRQGDDHLRNIKLGIKNTFPNITGAVTKTQDEINAVPANIDQIITQLVLHSMPKGTIIMWDLVNGGAIPSGWAECNGQVVSGYGTVPDFRDRYIRSRGTTINNGQTGGSASVNSGDAGGHTPTIQGHALTAAQLPAHDHALYVFETGSSSDTNPFLTTNAKGVGGNTDGNYAYRTTTTATAGANKLIQNDGSAAQPHPHTADAVPDHAHTVAVEPPFIGAIFIVKTTQYTAP